MICRRPVVKSNITAPKIKKIKTPFWPESHPSAWRSQDISASGQSKTSQVPRDAASAGAGVPLSSTPAAVSYQLNLLKYQAQLTHITTDIHVPLKEAVWNVKTEEANANNTPKSMVAPNETRYRSKRKR